MVADYLNEYADSFRAPIVQGAAVRSVRWRQGQFFVVSDEGALRAKAVVIATGYADVPAVPDFARELDRSIRQVTPDVYRNPNQLPDGAVLVVGASATGVQIADELAGAGRDVLLAVGRHSRVPRRYRGMDIMWWLESMGLLDRTIHPSETRRPEPSLQIVGRADGRLVDLPALFDRGVQITGRVGGINHRTVSFADDLRLTTTAADVRLGRLLDRIDQYATVNGLDAEIGPRQRPEPSDRVNRPGLSPRLDLRARGVQSVIWATGYRRRYPWLQLPVLDAAGEIRQTAGRTPFPGLLVVGMLRQTRRSSTFLDGVRHDAALVVDHLIKNVVYGRESERKAS
jgi:putative flavoprotein involved in K+ transport